MASRKKPPPDTAAPGPVIVGIGASAGGLDAFTQLLGSLPPKPGAALVLVQHLSPDHESFLPALLSRSTPMPVLEAKDGSKLEADKVHVIPPAHDIEITDGHLRLVPRPSRRSPHMPLDLFLTTLASVQGPRAIAVILSGTGSDGTLGCKAVKAAGGIAFAQDPATARYDGMPKSVIAAGCVDFVMSPEAIADEIVRLASDPYVRVARPEKEPGPPRIPDQAALEKIFGVLEKRTGADFSSYKKTTVLRRVQRRMVLHRVDRIADYAARLEADASEADALHDDLLIHVTSFFRDPEAFVALGSVLPALLRGRDANAPVRVWVPGCATGEEAYSVAMCLLETLSDLPSNPPVQVFATDLSESAIETARLGSYLENVAAVVSPERLARFFVKVDGSYHVSKAVRDLIVFARHDVARDPPFSRLDLISCRNLLIYLEPGLQRRVLGTFHYALAPGGHLLLGRSETVGASADLFDLVDKDHRIYTKLAVHSPPATRPAPAAPTATGGPAARAAATPAPSPRSDGEREAERLLLTRFAPASVLVDESGQVLHMRGPVDRFLSHSQGAASHDLARMMPRELVPELKRLLREAGDQGVPRGKEGLVLRQEGRSRRVGIEVLPIRGPASGERRFLVLFQDDAQAPVRGASARPRPKEAEAETEVARLEQDLEAFRHYLRTMEEENAAAQEELQSAHEEVLSSNEELQSVNEELLTAKEELQSGNEELVTLNDELRNRNLELQRLTDDLDNLLASATVPLVMLGPDLVVRRFTPAAARLLKMETTDVGRPLLNVRTAIGFADAEADILGVMQGREAAEREVRDGEGRWWRLGIRPYRTRANEVGGAVLVLTDVDALRRGREALEAGLDFAEAIVNTVREPLLVLGADLRVRHANRAFYEMFAGTAFDTVGAPVSEMGGGRWNLPEVRAALEEILVQGDAFENHPVELDLAAGRRTLRLNGRRLRQAEGAEEMILLAMEDVTDAVRLDEERADLVRRSQDARDAAVAANKMKDEFVATASHELRGPLNAMVGWVHVLSSGATDEATRARALAAIDRSVKSQTRLVAELLDVTRIMTGKLDLSMRLVELLEVVETAMQAVRPTAQTKNIELVLRPAGTSETVLGDPDRLHQVIWNLLSNAVKFTPRGGRVEISVGRDGTSSQVTVTDSGQGIAADFLPYVFERFRQADSSTTRNQPGLGLGLAIARQLVEMHGGTIEARSAGEGKGSSFVVCLPVPALRVHPPEAQDVAPPRKGARADALAGLRVLIVDDDPDSRDVVATVLERAGARVTPAASASEALYALDGELPDVIVSDVGMPGRDGFDLIRDVRKRSEERGGRTPAAALTAFAAEGDRRKSAEAGFDAYLAKPADAAELVATVGALAGRAPR